MASTFSKTNKEPVSGGAMASVAKSFGTVKSVPGKAAGVNAEEVKKLKDQVAEMQENNAVLEKEREFYFMKL